MKRGPILTLLLLIVALAIVAWYAFWELPHRAEEETLHSQEQIQDLGAIVTRIRDLNRLETATMKVQSVSTITQSYKLVPNTLGGDSLTFVAVGDVIAGVDFAKLQPEDVRRDPDGSVVVRLPPTEVLVTRIDNEQSHVINRNTGFFRRADPGLESRARLAAESGVRREALKEGILPLAAKNAETHLADLFHSLGFQKVRFIETSPATRPGG